MFSIHLQHIAKRFVFKKIVFFFASSLCFAACKSAKVASTTSTVTTPVVKKDKIVEISIKSIEAIDLEEDLSFADEVSLTYALTLVDENKKILKVVNTSWGVESLKKGQIVKAEQFKKLEIVIPEKGTLLSSVILMEVDNYEKAMSTIKKINELGGLAKIPATIINIAEYETPLAIVFASLQAAGLGLKVADRFDQDDLLGQSTFELKLDSLSNTQKNYPVDLTFEGEHLKNTFRYKLTYELKIR